MTVRPVRPLREKRGWAFNIAVPLLKPTLLATTKHTWIDGEKIPASGGCILVLNHVSHIDPLTAAHIVYDHGRKPRYLAKSGLFKNKVLGYFLRHTEEVDAYLALRSKQSESVRKKHKANSVSTGIRERLVARRGIASN